MKRYYDTVEEYYENNSRSNLPPKVISELIKYDRLEKTNKMLRRGEKLKSLQKRGLKKNVKPVTMDKNKI